MQSVIDCIVFCGSSVLCFLFKQMESDVILWAIAFTMNTWATTLDGHRKRWIESTKKAIKKSRLKVQQAKLVEALEFCRLINPEGSKSFLREGDAYLSKLDKWEVQYDKTKAIESIDAFPEFILSVCAFFSIVCIIGRWFYNITLIVLLPFPCLMCHYTGQRYFRLRYIERKRAKLLSRIPKEILRSCNKFDIKKQEKEQFEKQVKMMEALRQQLTKSSNKRYSDKGQTAEN